jgi:transposase
VLIVAEVVDAVVGIDTHRDTHYAEIATATGARIATLAIPNTTSGFATLLDWIAQHSPGPRVVCSIEGTRSYGLRLTRAVTAAGIAVIEAEQPNRKTRRGRGKSDPIDAHLAVTFALNCALDKLPTPRADGDREALRILLTGRRELVTTQTAHINQLRDLLRGSTLNPDGDPNGDPHGDPNGDPDGDPELARARFTDTVLTRLTRRRLPAHATREQATRHGEIRRLAATIRRTSHELKTNHTQLQAIVDDLVPGLTARRGIGPVTAAQAIVAFSHPGRCRNDGAFASLAGTRPLEASSGKTTRHRLNRGGDRTLNAAIHTIALTRMRCCEHTRAYIAKRTAQGKTLREIRRCLKRYITRELYRALNTALTTPPPPTTSNVLIGA